MVNTPWHFVLSTYTPALNMDNSGDIPGNLNAESASEIKFDFLMQTC